MKLRDAQGLHLATSVMIEEPTTTAADIEAGRRGRTLVETETQGEIVDVAGDVAIRAVIRIAMREEVGATKSRAVIGREKKVCKPVLV